MGSMIGLSIDKHKLRAAIVTDGGSFVCEECCDSPQDSYRETLIAIRGLIDSMPSHSGGGKPLGVAIPGSFQDGSVVHSPLPHLNGKDIRQDLQAALGREIHISNIGDSFTFYEAHHGQANDGDTVFGMFIDATCHGGLVINGNVLRGKNGIAGNWAHLPLPSPVPYELDGQDCWCGRTGCIETFLSSTGFEDDYFKITETHQSAAQIAAAAAQGDIVAMSSLQVLEDRLGRTTAALINIIDPDVIVLGGMVGSLERLMSNVPRKWPGYVIARRPTTRLLASSNSEQAVLAGAALLASNESAMIL